ncbi:hypothetical protein BJG93_02205 [Paraburkholderia sprentiae WSM5005]|uniref:Uncharacterized protein n=1 Tax=Paraburkholderia sprentiae WSM5005 TaxID=754502 RepID=A0A1I9YDF4_9BURK|nr:hypothetical protein [Paraburkholderia sprentiae]APA84337.2 hypothetical protein BJG93_02205 [Paraburkholderia sprentiae WSM5005]
MSFRTSKSEFVPTPEGEYYACLVQLVDLGRSPQYGTEQVAMRFELCALPGEPSLDEQGRGRPPRLWLMPMSLTVSAGSKLGRLLGGWDGVEPDDLAEEQDLSERLGRWARAMVIHTERNSRTFVNIDTLAPLEPGEALHLPQPYYKPSSYDVRDGRCEAYESLPDWMRERASSSPDWQANQAPKATPAAPPVKHSPAGTRKPALPAAAREAAGRFTGDDGFDALPDVPSF